MNMAQKAHAELLSELTPEFFEPIKPNILRVLTLLGDERCAALYSYCKDYGTDELEFIFWALMDDMNSLTPASTGKASEGALNRTHQMLSTAVRVAPAAGAYKVLDSKAVKSNIRASNNGTAREILRAAGQVINMACADELVVEMPDVKRHNPDTVTGAVVALTLNDPYSRPADLIRYLGTHWRELVPYADKLSSMSDFTLNTASHLVHGGPLVLAEGAL